MLTALFGNKHVPKYGSYDYADMADKIGLGTNVTFGIHDRPTDESVQAMH